MTEFTPKISKRSTEELIAIANSSANEWKDEAIQKATKELNKKESLRNGKKK